MTREPGGATGTDLRGTVEVGRRVLLPRGAQPPIHVYVNGVEKVEGQDYTRRGREINFTRPIVKEGKLGPIRWLSMLIGIAGTYRKNEVVDVEFKLEGETKLISDAKVQPD